ncbi:YbaB/EbfC family nucleoid-associated protein [Streptomyces lydicus]|uniref:YbaB/EbfC family nucleoid-associated protein n=1 Tax=Streptomyces lydicus TaxID=47763 RepID=UPI001012DF05|nr:YbaB/EbfC family nucleoid-associated protein [Streptomyces lydicus]MCZ1007829.1 YbaB/EbfC family nucleoid-associated protein [Streptomyces lydicus]
MSTPYDQQIEDLLAEYRDAREQSVDTRRQINEIQATVTAPRQVVKVTVGAQGQVLALDFPTGAYRNMAPKDLSRVIQATLDQARTKALSQVMEVAVGRLPKGMTPADMVTGNFDPRDMSPKDIEMPDFVREYVERGLGARQGGGARS